MHFRKKLKFDQNGLTRLIIWTSECLALLMTNKVMNYWTNASCRSYCCILQDCFKRL